MTAERRMTVAVEFCRHLAGGVCDKCLLRAIRETEIAERTRTARVCFEATPFIGETWAKKLADQCRTGDA